VRKTYFSPEALRNANGAVVNKLLALRNPRLWGATVCKYCLLDTPASQRTNEQDTTPQVAALKSAGCERIFRELRGVSQCGLVGNRRAKKSFLSR
jgi:hypothetical protein